MPRALCTRGGDRKRGRKKYFWRKRKTNVEEYLERIKLSGKRDVASWQDSSYNYKPFIDKKGGNTFKVRRLEKMYPKYF